VRTLVRLAILVLLLIWFVPTLLSMVWSLVAVAVTPLAQILQEIFGYSPMYSPFAARHYVSGMTPVTSGMNLVTLLFLILVIFAVVRLFKREKPRSETKARMDADDGRLIQELHQGFSRLGERVEALETILLDARRAR